MPPKPAKWALALPKRKVDTDGAARVVVELTDGAHTHTVALTVTDAHQVEMQVTSPAGAPPLTFGPIWSNG